MLARMVRAQPDTPLGLRNRAILLAGFGGALRRSEIVGAQRSATSSWLIGKGGVLTVRRSKTDQHGAGQAVAVWRSDDPEYARTALRRWLNHRATRHADDPLFIGLRAGGVMTAARLSDKAVVRLVRTPPRRSATVIRD